MSERAAVAAELVASARERTLVAGVIGLGFIGTTLLHGLLAAGFTVVGVDRSEDAVRACRDRTAAAFPDATGWLVGTDPALLEPCALLVVAVRALVREGQPADLEPFAAVARTLRGMQLEGRLILVESTLPVGGTRRFAAQALDLDPEAPTFVAHSPERLSVGDDWRAFRRLPHLTGGLDPLATSVAAAVLGQVVDRVVPVSSPEVSELSKLLENAFMTVGISLVGEISRVAAAAGIEATEVCEAAATMSSGYHPFFPGPGIGGHCLPGDLSLLRESFRSLEQASPLLDATAWTLQQLPRQVVHRLAGLLAPDGLAGARILLVGVGFKPGSAETWATPAVGVARALALAGATAAFLDELVPRLEVDGVALPRVELGELGGFDAVVVLSGDRRARAELLRGTGRVLLDASGGRGLHGEGSWARL